MVRRTIFSLAALASASAMLVGCSDFRGGQSTGSDASTSDSATPSPSTRDGGSTGNKPLPPGTGPGPRGALPTGFCCESDAECRFRHCVDWGGGRRMCADDCYQSGFCENAFVKFTCEKGDAGAGPTRGMCAPPVRDTVNCISQEQYRYGTRKIGQCCAFGMDGNAGWECEGAQCMASGSNPYVCTHVCDTTLECEGAFVCMDVAGLKRCVPANSPYTCN